MERKDTHKNYKKQIHFLVTMAMLIAIETIFCFTPFLGAIKLGPISATLAMVPVIISALLFGLKAGTFMGLLAGVYSFVYWTFVEPGNPSAIVFTPFNAYSNIGSYWSLVVCIVPRVLTPVVAYFVNKLLQKLFKKSSLNAIAYGCAGILGSLTNTFLVLFGTYFLWGHAYAAALQMEFSALLGAIGVTILINGIPEAIVSCILSIVICLPIKKYILNPTTTDTDPRQVNEK